MYVYIYTFIHMYIFIYTYRYLYTYIHVQFSKMISVARPLFSILFSKQPYRETVRKMRWPNQVTRRGHV